MGNKSSSSSSKSKKKTSHLSSKRNINAPHHHVPKNISVSTSINKPFTVTSSRASPISIPGNDDVIVDEGQLRHFSPVDISLIGRTPPDNNFTLSGLRKDRKQNKRIDNREDGHILGHLNNLNDDKLPEAGNQRGRGRGGNRGRRDDHNRNVHDEDDDHEDIDGSSDDSSQSSEEDEDETQAQKDDVQLVRVYAEAEQEESSNTIEDIDNAEQHLLSQLRALHSKLEGLRGRKSGGMEQPKPLSKTYSDTSEVNMQEQQQEQQQQQQQQEEDQDNQDSEATHKTDVQDHTSQVLQHPRLQSQLLVEAFNNTSAKAANQTDPNNITPEEEEKEITMPPPITPPITYYSSDTTTSTTTTTTNPTTTNPTTTNPTATATSPTSPTTPTFSSASADSTQSPHSYLPSTPPPQTTPIPPIPPHNTTANTINIASFASSLPSNSKLIVCAVNKPVNVSVSNDGLGYAYTRKRDAFTVAIETLRSSGTNVEWVFVPTVDAPRQKLRTAMTRRLIDDYHCHPMYLNREVKGAYGDMCTRLFSVFYGIHLEGHFGYHKTQADIHANVVEEERLSLDAYRVVNEHFAQQVNEIYEEGDLVLVYNYQLLLLPQMLRRRCPNVTCGFFFDCPFPPTEFFRTIPVRNALLHGVLESDLVLFHHFDHVMCFNTTCTLLLGVDATAHAVHTINGRLVSVMVCPLGVDPMQHDAGTINVQLSAKSLRERLKKYRIVSAVDTMDTFKGLPQKILAFEEFLAAQIADGDRRELRRQNNNNTLTNNADQDEEEEGRASDTGTNPLNNSINIKNAIGSTKTSDYRKKKKSKLSKISITKSDNSNTTKHISNSNYKYNNQHAEYKQVIFILVLSPAHETGNFYECSTKKRNVLKSLSKQVNGLVGRVNGRYGTADYTPIHYIRYGLSEEDTIALLSMTDVYLATSLSEGITMSALEFVAAQSREGEIQSRRVMTTATTNGGAAGGAGGSTNTTASTTSITSSHSNTNNMGVLLYSEFAGCARSLKGAVIVNPYDVAAVGNSIREALIMGSKQKVIRWLQLSQYIQTYTALNWAERMIRSLALSSLTSEEYGSGKPLDMSLLLQDYKTSTNRIFIFSYGGVLTDPATLPSLSRPDEGTIRILEKLSRDSKNLIVIVDTSSRITLDHWFRSRLSGLNVLLVAENGYCCSWLNEKGKDDVDDEQKDDGDHCAGGSSGNGGDEKDDEEQLNNVNIDGSNASSHPNEQNDTNESQVQHVVGNLVDHLVENLTNQNQQDQENPKNSQNSQNSKNSTEEKKENKEIEQEEEKKDKQFSNQPMVPSAISNLQIIDLHTPGTWRLCGVTDTITHWRAEISAVLEHFKLRTPGSFVDITCDSCMIWYYTNADPAFGFRQAKDLHQHLDRMLRAWPLEAVFLRPRKCIVIRPMSSNTQRLAEIALRVSNSNKQQNINPKIKKTDNNNTKETLNSNSSKEQSNSFESHGGVGVFGGGSRIVAEALSDPNCFVMCSCCDAISQRMLIPLTGKRVKNVDKVSKLFTLSVGMKISRAQYYIESHSSLLNSISDLLDKK